MGKIQFFSMYCLNKKQGIILKKTTAFVTLFFVLLSVNGCENPVENSNNNSGQNNTLNDPALNDHFIGSASEYFYDFEKDINVKFYRWDRSKINQPILFNSTTDTLNFRTFPEYLLNIAPGEMGEPFTDLNNNGLYDPGEPFIDQGNGFWDIGEPFTDSNNNGFYDSGEPYTDLNGDGYWTGTEHLYDINGDCRWNDAETWTDLNNDGVWTPKEPLFNEYINFGVWDPHEPYEDLNGNGQYDFTEPYTDVNLDGGYTTHEPFTDLDGDGVWDAAEPFTDKYNSFFPQPWPGCNCNQVEIFPGYYQYNHCGDQGTFEAECGDTFSDLNGNGEYDPVAEPYEDIYYPHEQYNPDEPFTDLNGDGVWTPAEPFTNLNTNAPGTPVWNDDEEFTDWNGDGVWTPAEPLTYEYFVNGIWDDAESFDDIDGDGIWDNYGEQFEDQNGDCLWSVGESFLDQPDHPSVAEWNSFTERNLLFHESFTRNVPVEIASSQIRHLKQMYWDFDLERYTSVVSNWDGMDTTITFSDPYDSLIYQQPIVSLPTGDTSYYIDRSEWIGTSYVYSSGDSLFATTFRMKQKIVGSDSLMFHKHADCNINGSIDSAEPYTDVNGNGQYDVGEPYDDLANGSLDPAEPFLDRDSPGENGYGVYNPDEPFMDMNCNGVWDPAETVDTGNGMWDDDEPDELFVRTLEPNNLVVSFDNYPDLSNPRILSTINSEEWFYDCGLDNLCPRDQGWTEPDEGEHNGILDPGELFDDFNDNSTCCDPADSVITYDGRIIQEVINVNHFDNVRTKQMSNVDSLVTIYSNQIIENMEINPNDNNYYVTKSKWLWENSVQPGIQEDYDYHIFKANSHIYQLIHPSYFLPPGFWNNTQGDPPLEDGFWFENFTVDEVLYFTPGGHFRDGEYVYRDTTISTNIGIYYVEKSSSVSVDNVTVPARKVLGFLNENNQVVCYANESLENILTVSKCPKDTTFTEVFKITNQIEMTLLGPGIKYGEKTVTWLARNNGMVKEQVYIHWNDAPWGTSNDWIEYSRLEMAEYRNIDSGSGGLLRNIFGQMKSVNLNTLGHEGGLDYDPYQIRRTAGFQRVSLPSNND